MGWILEVALAICLIIVVGGAVTYGLMRLFARISQEMDQDKKQNRQLETRLKTLEQRMDDMQDIILSMEEKTTGPRI